LSLLILSWINSFICFAPSHIYLSKIFIYLQGRTSSLVVVSRYMERSLEKRKEENRARRFCSLLLVSGLIVVAPLLLLLSSSPVVCLMPLVPVVSAPLLVVVSPFLRVVSFRCCLPRRRCFRSFLVSALLFPVVCPGMVRTVAGRCRSLRWRCVAMHRVVHRPRCRRGDR